jgi:hypothetical protein
MPSAVANVQDTVRKDLRTCPEGFVELRRMTYGQVVQRRTLSKLSLLNNKGRGNQSVMGEMAMASKETSLFEFAHCIVDHNLEDESGRKLNLANESDVDRLDPKVGQEIESFIAEMNNFEDDEVEQGN